ncbi:MAG: PQQ-binding-like beta-propeller repeat protein [Candidatus Marinimicrobia bacterium]|nr:PQQ-binding-like beta-propeller repeat protein [Candidatus Neomarinimicrobiota bacterium]
MKAKRLLLILILLTALTVYGQQLLFRYAWFSDTHIGTQNGATDLRAAVDDVNSQDDLGFVIISGDITELDVDGNLDTAKIILDELKIPYYIIPGNHDTKWSSSGTVKFPALFGDSHFNMEYKGFRFIGIHQGPLLRMGDGYIAPEDLRWLAQELKAMPDHRQPLFLITHYPIDSTVSNWYELIDIIKPYNVQAIMHGHGHRNKTWDFEGIPGIMGRSTLQRGEQPGGYNLVDVYRDSLVFRERISGGETKMPWHSQLLEEKDYLSDPKKYNRPDFSINDRYSSVREVWSRKFDWAIASSPAVGKNIVITTNGGGYIQAFRLSDGKALWTFRAGKAVYSTPAIAKTSVVFGCTDSLVYCLDTRNGKLKWTYKSGAPILAVPVIANKTVYIGASDGKFRALNLRNGKLRWSYDAVTGFVESKPFIYDNLVIFGAWDRNLYALDAKTGALTWKWNDGAKGFLYSPAAVWPVATRGKVFISAPDRYMSCINAGDGSTLWRSNRYKVRETVGISEDGLTVFARTMWDTVFAIDPSADSLETIWVDSVGYGYDIDPSMPVEKGGTLFFGTKDGYVYALDAETGEAKGIHRMGVALVNTVVPLDNRRVVATSMDGKVVLLNFE